LLRSSIEAYYKKLGFRLKLLKRVVYENLDKRISLKILKLFSKLRKLSSKFSKIPTDSAFNYLARYSKTFRVNSRRRMRLSKKRRRSLKRMYSLSQNYCKPQQCRGIAVSTSVFQGSSLSSVLSVHNLIKSHHISTTFLEEQAGNYNYRMWFYYFYVMRQTKLSPLLIGYFLKRILETRALRKKQRFLFSSLRRFLHIFSDCDFLAEAKGLKIQIKGRFGGKNRSSVYRIQLGSLTLSTISQKISYAFVPALTVNGSFGIKVWIALI